MDSEGYLWNCRFYGNCIVRVAPDGRIDRIIDMPVSGEQCYELHLWRQRLQDALRYYRVV